MLRALSGDSVWGGGLRIGPRVQKMFFIFSDVDDVI